MSNTVSHAYLLGIREARGTLRTHEKECGPLTLEDARGFLANSEECARMGFTGEALETVKGERDFWRNQVKRLFNQHSHARKVA